MTKLSASRQTRRQLNEIGLERQQERAAFEGPLTPESIPVIPAGQETIIEPKGRKKDIPSDIEVMFLGKMCAFALDFQTRMQNTLAGMKRAYGDVDDETEKKLTEYASLYIDDFEEAKNRATKVIRYHPLAENLCKIKGFTPYALGLLMSYIKDIKRFKTPAALCTYAGTVPKYGMHISKKNILAIRKLKHDEFDNVTHEEAEEAEEAEVKEFGFNTRMQQRLYILQESLLRAGGFFYHEYKVIRERLHERAITKGECFMPTDDEVKASKGMMEKGKYYMVGRKNQSLIMWSHRNACWRITRIFLHILYHEWCLLEGIAPRIPYAVEYLGHERIITIEEILEFEKKK
jgi:hypothetical protein